MDKEATVKSVIRNLRKMGMSDEQIVASSRVIQKQAATPTIASLLNSLKVPLAMTVVPGAAVGYVHGRTSSGGTSEDKIHDIKSMRRADELLAGLDTLLKSKEHRLKNEKRKQQQP
jgi:hypothetical protein